MHNQQPSRFGKLSGVARNRFVVLGLICVVASAAILARLFDLQVIQGAQYVQRTAVASENRTITEIAPRGRIMDRNGVPIAVNEDVFALHIVNNKLDEAKLNEALLRICAILERNNDTWLRSLERYLAFDPHAAGGFAWSGASGDDNDSAGTLGGASGGASGGAMEDALEDALDSALDSALESALRFARDDIDEIEVWEKNTLGMSAQDIDEHGREPSSLFKHLASDIMYSIAADEGYSLGDAFKIASMRYLITAAKGAFDAGQSVRVASNISPMSIAELEENAHSLVGIDIQVEPLRRYIEADSVAHVLGYVGAITEAQYAELRDDDYEANDIVGQYGVEAQNEAYLRGRNGEKRVEVFAGGASAVEIAGKPALPGSDITLTIDMTLQKIAYASLEKNIGIIRQGGDNGHFTTDSDKNLRDADAGSAVAVDVHTGEVLLMVNYPTFSPSIFLAGPDDAAAQQAIRDLWNDPMKSSWNRAIQGTYAPGSTFKPITAITALQEGVINRNTQVYDAARVNIGGRDLFCLEGGHGHLTLKTALETSCNVFFYEVGTKSTIANLSKWARQFGLGVKTGIDLPFEVAGIMSSQEFKREQFNDIWRPADTAQVSIGQLYNAFTPLQMACYMSALANGGDYYKPYVTKQITRYDGSTVRTTVPEARRIPVDIGNIDAIKEGMVASTTEIDGTAVRAFGEFPIQVAGKTGTAETGREAKQSSNAVFVCYAPADDPKIALAVVVEKGAWGSYAAPIARDILEAYFGIAEVAREDDAALPASSGLVR